MRLNQRASSGLDSYRTTESLVKELHELRDRIDELRDRIVTHDDEIVELNRKIEYDDVDVLIECQEMVRPSHSKRMAQIRDCRRRHGEAGRADE